MDDWLSPERANEWDFTLDEGAPATQPGTEIVVENLYPGITEEFADQAFQNAIRRVIARDYAIILGKGFNIVIGGTPIIGYRYEIRESADFIPFRKTYVDNDVQVTPEATSDDIIEDSNKPPSFREWARGDFDIEHGRLSGADAAILILLPIAAAAIGMMAFGIEFQIAEHVGL